MTRTSHGRSVESRTVRLDQRSHVDAPEQNRKPDRSPPLKMPYVVVLFKLLGVLISPAIQLILHTHTHTGSYLDVQAAVLDLLKAAVPAAGRLGLGSATSGVSRPSHNLDKSNFGLKARSPVILSVKITLGSSCHCKSCRHRIGSDL